MVFSLLMGCAACKEGKSAWSESERWQIIGIMLTGYTAIEEELCYQFIFDFL